MLIITTVGQAIAPVGATSTTAPHTHTHKCNASSVKMASAIEYSKSSFHAQNVKGVLLRTIYDTFSLCVSRTFIRWCVAARWPVQRRRRRRRRRRPSPFCQCAPDRHIKIPMKEANEKDLEMGISWQHSKILPVYTSYHTPFIFTNKYLWESVKQKIHKLCAMC